MTSSADREPPQDANPYQSPTHSGWADDPIAFLQQLPGGAIEVRGSLQPKDVFLAHFGWPFGFIAFGLLQLAMTVLVVLCGMGTSIPFLLAAEAEYGPSILLWLIPAGIQAGMFLLLALIARNWISAMHLKRFWNQRRGIFADQVRRVTVTGTSSTCADEQTDTPWSDYAHYRLWGNQLQLHLRKPAVLLRRWKRAERAILWMAGSRWYDGIDIFTRDQFASREQWQLFVRLVKEKLHRWW